MRCAAWPRAAANSSGVSEEIEERAEAGGRGTSRILKCKGLLGMGSMG